MMVAGKPKQRSKFVWEPGDLKTPEEVQEAYDKAEADLYIALFKVCTIHGMGFQDYIPGGQKQMLCIKK